MADKSFHLNNVIIFLAINKLWNGIFEFVLAKWEWSQTKKRWNGTMWAAALIGVVGLVGLFCEERRRLWAGGQPSQQAIQPIKHITLSLINLYSLIVELFSFMLAFLHACGKERVKQGRRSEREMFVFSWMEFVRADGPAAYNPPIEKIKASTRSLLHCRVCFIWFHFIPTNSTTRSHYGVS